MSSVERWGRLGGGERKATHPPLSLHQGGISLLHVVAAGLNLKRKGDANKNGKFNSVVMEQLAEAAHKVWMDGN